MTFRTAAGDKEPNPSETDDSSCSTYLNNPCVVYKPYVRTISNRFEPSNREAVAGIKIRTDVKPSREKVSAELARIGSPLVGYTDLLLDSPYWSTILGICSIEEYGCTVNPSGTNNLWGLMSGGHLIRFSSLSEGIQAIDSFLERADTNGRTTIESFRGWYCASECTNWESTVKTKKAYYESL